MTTGAVLAVIVALSATTTQAGAAAVGVGSAAAMVDVASSVVATGASAAGTAALPFPTPTWIHLNGRVQSCSWSYTELTGTVCRTRSTFVAARIRYFGIPPTPEVEDVTAPMLVSVWNARTRAWQEGPYQLDKPTKTVWLDGSLVSARLPKVGRARRVWIDRCSYWLYVGSRGTHCQLGQTTRVRAKRTKGGGVSVRRPGGTFGRLAGYTWRPRGHGFVALDAAKLPGRISRPRPVLAAVSSGAPRTGSASSYTFVENITYAGEPGAPNYGRNHSFCPTRPIVVHVDYAGAAAAGYSTTTAAALVTAAMNEASAASGYRWVLGPRVPLGPLSTLFQRYGTQRMTRYPFVSLDNEMLIGFGTTKAAAFDTGEWAAAAGVGGPDLQDKGDAFHTPTFGGIVLLNADWLSSPETSATAALDVALHEVGHGFGLDHVADPGQVMNPSTLGFTRYSAGDAAGMRWLRAHSSNC